MMDYLLASIAPMWRSQEYAPLHSTDTCALHGMQVADIGHCALPWDIHREWLQRLEDEFFEQVACASASVHCVYPCPLHKELPHAWVGCTSYLRMR